MLGISRMPRATVGALLLPAACSIYTPDLLANRDGLGGGGDAAGKGGASGAGGNNACQGSSCAGAGPAGASGQGGGGSGASGGGSAGAGGDPGNTLPLLSWTIDPPQISINLTTYGQYDWAHYGFLSAGDYNHKAGTTALIPKVTPAGTRQPIRKIDDPTTYQWENGTPTLAATTRTGLTIMSGDAGAIKGEGFQLVLPTGKEVRRLRLWIGIVNAEGIVSGKLSDPRADVELLDRVASPQDMWIHDVLVVDFGNAAPGTTFTVRWVLDSKREGTVPPALSVSAALLENRP